MGRHRTMTCNLCCKTIRGDHLKIHMKKHENKPQSIDEAETVKQTYRSSASLGKCTSLNLEELKKNIVSQMNEFDRKIELGRNSKIIINECGFNINGLESDMKEALKTYELYGKNMDMKEIIWRGWQKDLRQYLDKQCDRKIIWVVGKRGN